MKKNFCLSHHNYDMTKRWYIRYSYKNKANRVVTGKIYNGINRGKTVPERLRLYEKIINSLNDSIEVQKLENEVENAFYLANESILLCLKKNSERNYSGKIKIFLAYLKKQNISKLIGVDKNVAVKFLSVIGSTRSNKTYNDYVFTLSRACKLITGFDNPFKDIKKVTSQSVPKSYFQEHQIEILKKNIDNDSQLFLCIEMIFYTLIRPNELRLLKISDIDLITGTIQVNAENSKNKKTERVAIPNAFLSRLIDLKLHNYPSNYYLFGKDGTPSNKCWNEGYFRKKHGKVLKELGFEHNYSLYSWKHTGAIQMVKSGIHIKYIQLQGRWHDLDQVNSYLRQLGMSDMSEIKQKHIM